MKSLVAMLMLFGALGLAAGCTPTKSFCPIVGADAGGVCPIFGDDGMAPVDDTGITTGPCGSNQQATVGPDGGIICIDKP